MIEQIVFAGAQAASFAQAAKFLDKLAGCAISEQRVHRLTTRIGRERLAECAAQTAAFVALDLPARRLSPHGVAPPVAAISMDGGRLQIFDRAAPRAATAEGHWRESKIGVLESMASARHERDPCPELPGTFRDAAKMSDLTREIHGVATATPEATGALAGPDEGPPSAAQRRAGQPEPLVKSVVATCQDIHAFAPRLAAAASARGFFAAERRAFVADGSETNWSVWRRYFSHFTPIVDFVHALTYVHAAALASRDAATGWAIYRDWAQWLWSGQASRVLAALQTRQEELGAPSPDDAESAPRRQVHDAWRYLTNQQSRMQYDEYRRLGLPITSAQVESTIKQINRRVKGTEKFWNDGADPLLTLAADHLSETADLAHFWRTRHLRHPGHRHVTAA